MPTLQISLLLRGTVNRIKITDDAIRLYSWRPFVPFPVHGRRDQTRSDHTCGRTSTTHLAIKDKISGALIGRCYSL